MTAFRLISLPTHSALELFAGLFTMAAPFLFAFGPAATVVSVVAGALIVGLALAATTAEPGVPSTFSVSTHHALDQGAAIGLVGAALLVGIDGDRTAAAVLGAIALGQLALMLTTRYSARG